MDSIMHCPETSEPAEPVPNISQKLHQTYTDLSKILNGYRDIYLYVSSEFSLASVDPFKRFATVAVNCRRLQFSTS